MKTLPLFLVLALVPRQTPQAEIEVRRDVLVPMRDGVKLATDLYLPARNAEKLPVILVRTPYNKNGERGNGTYFASRGYAFVAQDTRGRYASEGVWRFLNDDGPDGVDAAAWVGKQPWSNGKIGMMGTSYVGGTQHAMALERPPELATIIPVDAVSNMGRQSMRHAGAFEMRFWNWVMLNSARGSQAARDPAAQKTLQEMADQRRLYLAQLPLRKGTTPLKLAPDLEEWLVEAMKHGANDAFWRHNNVVDFPERYKDIPVYLVGGWYDSWAGNTTANYAALSGRIQGPVYLIMGPWIHGAQGRSAHGQLSFGKDAAIADPLAWRLEWFDAWLKGKPTKVGREAPFSSRVRIFVMGTGDCSKGADGLDQHGGYWRDEAEWPLARAKPTPFYFHGGGTLSAEAPAADRASTSYVFDPKDPVPTIGGQISSGDGILLQGGWDQRGGPHVWNFPQPIPLSARNDVLVFQTPPLAADVEVTGEIEVKLWVSSDAPDTDFTAKLVDVHPPGPHHPGGFDLLIGDAILRARFRDSLSEEKRMEPGNVYPVRIRLYPTSNVFKKGHRIRVDLSSSNFPRFDVNPNTGEPLNDHRQWKKAVNTIHHDRQRPSHILLPLVPPK
jgi:hypothetical protein